MLTPRSLSVVRTVRGLALLAAGPFVLAACTSTSSRLLFEETCASSGARATAPCDGSRPGDRRLAAPSADAPGTSGSGGDALPPDSAIGGAPPSAGPPRLADSRMDAACACWCDPRRSCGSECLNKSYAVAAADIVGYEFLLNQFDRHFISYKVFGSDFESIADNLTGKWVYDKDPFKTNQFAHPYGGSIYHGFARSAGLTFWESFGYDVAGSALWEIAGERDPPSINDQITTPIAGAFLGEALFRTSNLILERARCGPSAATEFWAALISPSTGFNRWAYGDRFDAVYPSHDPAVFSWWGVGARRNVTLTDIGVLSRLNRDVGVAAYSIDYGLPGKSGYSYDRPFDYFHFEATATSSENAIPESVMIRGLLAGTDYCGPKYSGIWGVYGVYDYFSPEIFKLSSTALSVGTTWQYLASDRFALQGSLLGGLGFTATGTTANERVERGYRYSVSPQGLVALRGVYRDVAMLDVTANEYYLADSLSSTRATGSENVVRAEISLTIRIFGLHAIRIGFIEASRDASFESIIDTPQRLGGLSVSYTRLDDTNFGVVRR
jgi:hypothetical protein